MSGDDVARLCIASHVTLGQRARESKPSETSEGEKAVRRRRAILSSDATAISLAVEGGQAEQTRSFISRLHSLNCTCAAQPHALAQASPPRTPPSNRRST